MVAVLSMLSTIFCAVPAFMRVEPAMTSGPTRGAMVTSASSPSGEGRLQTSPMVSAPRRFASATAPSTQGVRPLAVMPTTTSASPTSA